MARSRFSIRAGKGGVWRLKHASTKVFVGAFADARAARKARELADDIICDDERDHVDTAAFTFWAALCHMGFLKTDMYDRDGWRVLALAAA